jgi:hypothetical protein
MKEITNFYKAKDGSMKSPGIYLGLKIMKVQLGNSCEVCTASPFNYVKNAGYLSIQFAKNVIAVFEYLIDKDAKGYTLKNIARNPFPSNYRPELDVMDEMGESLASRYMQLIRIVMWAVELRQVDIFNEVSILSQYQVSPCVGHLKVGYHIFLYIKKRS